MTHHQNLKIIAPVGLSGSGKTTALTHFTEKGIPKVHVGNMAYEIMAERGIHKGEENEKNFRIAIREELGPEVYARRAAEQMHKLAEAGQHHIILDGLYSWDEYKFLRHEFPGELILIAVVAPKHLRYRWLEQREDRPQSHEVTMARDTHEIEDIQKGGPIAAADYFVMNDGTFEHFYEQLDAIARETNFLA